MKINVVTLCSGYDSQCLALERLKHNFPNFDYELIAWAEFDPESKSPIEKQPAVVVHNVLFPLWENRNMGDITTCDWGSIKEPIDLLCYSTPCQSISNAGLQAGFKEGSGTKSSVIWSVLNAIKTLRPKYLLMENVAAMVQSKFIKDFQEWQKAVETFGYTHYTQVLNSKDYGVPQNRERVFMISVRNDIGTPYFFPKPFKLQKRLKDVLEKDVDKKYYLSNKLIESLSRDNKGYKGMKPSAPPYDGIASCLTARMFKMGRSDNYVSELEPLCSVHPNSHKLEFNAKTSIKPIAPALRATDYKAPHCVYEPQVEQIGNIVDDTNIGFKNPQRGRVYSQDGLAPCLNCCAGGGLEPKIVEYDKTNKTLCINSKVNGKQPSLEHRIYDSEGISTAITTGFLPSITEPTSKTTYRIRKLTPRECFRLMGVDDNDIDTIQSAKISNSSQYKLAGNSITIPVLYHLFRKLFIQTENENDQLKLFSGNNLFSK